MKTIEVILYKFAELSEQAKKKAVENLCDINVDHDWWNSTYEDAERIGLKITGFDLDRNRHATGKFIWNAKDVAEAILKEHGEKCETHQTAKDFLEKALPLIEKESEIDYRDYDLEGEISDLEDDFLKSLLEDYSIMLQKESEYLQSEKAIIETIEANDYDFTENGKLY